MLPLCRNILTRQQYVEQTLEIQRRNSHWRRTCHHRPTAPADSRPHRLERFCLPGQRHHTGMHRTGPGNNLRPAPTRLPFPLSHHNLFGHHCPWLCRIDDGYHGTHPAGSSLNAGDRRHRPYPHVVVLAICMDIPLGHHHGGGDGHTSAVVDETAQHSLAAVPRWPAACAGHRNTGQCRHEAPEDDLLQGTARMAGHRRPNANARAAHCHPVGQLYHRPIPAQAADG